MVHFMKVLMVSSWCALLLPQAGCLPWKQFFTLQEKGVEMTSTETTTVMALKAEEIAHQIEGMAVYGENLLIAQRAFGKPFLLETSIYNAYPFPLRKSYLGKIVFFKKQGTRVALYERGEGLLGISGEGLTDQTPILLATYPLLFQNEEWVLIDWSKGTQSIVVTREGDDLFSGVERKLIYESVVAANYRDGDKLICRFNVVMEKQGPFKVLTRPAQVQWVFSAYHVNPRFSSINNDRQWARHFYQTSQRYDLTRKHRVGKIVKLDFSKTYDVILDEAIPEEIKSAIQDGFGYWNELLGQELFHIKMGTESASPFDMKNSVHWVTGLGKENFSWTDLSVMPLSGEVLNFKIYLDSTLSGQHDLKSLRSGVESRLMLKGFELFKSVEDESAVSVVRGRENGNPDMFRWVVAHEVGHVLGLRHNFAASMGGSLLRSQAEAQIRAYQQNGDLEADKFFAHSVMDYLPVRVMAYEGKHLKNFPQMKSYDAALLGILRGRPEAQKSPALRIFCDDKMAQAQQYLDCQQLDYGTSAIDSFQVVVEQRIDEMAQIYLRQFLEWRYGPHRSEETLDSIELDWGEILSLSEQSYSEGVRWGEATKLFGLEQHMSNDPMLRISALNERFGVRVWPLGWLVHPERGLQLGTRWLQRVEALASNVLKSHQLKSELQVALKGRWIRDREQWQYQMAKQLALVWQQIGFPVAPAWGETLEEDLVAVMNLWDPPTFTATAKVLCRRPFESAQEQALRMRLFHCR